MDSLMKLTIALLLTFSGIALFSKFYYAANYSEEWKRAEYSSYVDAMNSVSSPVVFLLIVLIPVCTLKKVKGNLTALGFVIAGIAFLLAGVNHKLALTFASLLTLAFLTLYLKKNPASTLIHSGVALFILNFALFSGSLHMLLFYLSSALYIAGLIVRFYLR